MTRLLCLLYFLPLTIAYAQDVHEAAPTAYTEPAGMTSVIVFLLLFFGGIVFFVFWAWYRNKKPKENH
ncbi:MAG TPA: hypothetical protein VLN59_03585 [Burkholderiales bacterium]|nr:hypothetical protein [Burkholderiales bacterium]